MTPPLEEQYSFALERDRALHRENPEEEPQENPEQRPIGWLIFIPAVVIGLVADAIELFTVGTIGWFAGLLLDMALVFVLVLSKPSRKHWKKWLWGPAIEKIPFINVFPFIRVGFLIWAFISSRSKTLRKLSKLTHLP